jgi:hypothetical protein
MNILNIYKVIELVDYIICECNSGCEACVYTGVENLLVYGPATLYLMNGIPHRDDDLPSIITHKSSHSSHTCYTEHWYKFGKLHRETLPAIIEYLYNDLVCTWMSNGIRINKSTYIFDEFGYISEWTTYKRRTRNMYTK